MIFGPAVADPAGLVISSPIISEPIVSSSKTYITQSTNYNAATLWEAAL